MFYRWLAIRQKNSALSVIFTNNSTLEQPTGIQRARAALSLTVLTSSSSKYEDEQACQQKVLVKRTSFYLASQVLFLFTWQAAAGKVLAVLLINPE